MWTNKMKPNPGVKGILGGRKADSIMDLQPLLDGVAFPVKDQVCSLGMLLDPALLLDKHLDS